MRIFFLLLAIALIFPDDGEPDGRRGNELYGVEDYELAAEAYRSGLAALDDGASAWIRYALQNNLGAALLKAGDPEGATEAFRRALASAEDRSDVARTTYNAGNAAFSLNELEAALARYRESLLNDPDNRDAKFNYEFVKRRLQEQEQQQQQQQQQEGDGEESEEDQQNEDGRGDQEQEQEGEPQNEDGEGEEQGEQPEQQDSQRPDADAQEPTDRLSEEQAQRILQALQNEEEQLLRQLQRQPARPQRVEKDW